MRWRQFTHFFGKKIINTLLHTLRVWTIKINHFYYKLLPVSPFLFRGVKGATCVICAGVSLSCFVRQTILHRKFCCQCDDDWNFLSHKYLHNKKNILSFFFRSFYMGLRKWLKRSWLQYCRVRCQYTFTKCFTSHVLKLIGGSGTTFYSLKT